jgi:hypothetical protein
MLSQSDDDINTSNKEVLKNHIRRILDVCETENENDQDMFKAIYQGLIGNFSVFSQPNFDDELKETFCEEVLYEVIADQSLNKSGKSRSELENSQCSSIFSEDVETPLRKYNLLQTWMITEWEFRKARHEQMIAGHDKEMTRFTNRVNYLMNQISCSESETTKQADVTKTKKSMNLNTIVPCAAAAGSEEGASINDKNCESLINEGNSASKFCSFFELDERNCQKLFQSSPSLREAVWAKINSDDVKPEDLLSGTDPVFSKHFRKQGAMVVKMHDRGWDDNTRESTFLNLDWITNTKVKLQTLSPDYQYVRQTLPDPETGILKKYEDMTGYDPTWAEFGALVEEIQENFKFAAQPLRLMGVVDRELFFINQIQSKMQAQYPYLQGVSLCAIGLEAEKKSRTAVSAQNAWNIYEFAERPTSITRQLLKICETTCSPSARQKVGEHEQQHEQQQDQQKENRRKMNGKKVDDEEEIERTGARSVEGDAEARKRRSKRKFLLSGENRGKKNKKPVGSKKLPATGAGGQMQNGGSPAGTSHLEMYGKKEMEVMHERIFELSDKASEKKRWGAGIVTPWLYYMSPFSYFPMHFEDYAFGSANVIVAEPSTQCWVVWYSIPGDQISLLHEFLKDTLKNKYQIDCLEERFLWVNPESIAAWNSKRDENQLKLEVFRHVQGPGEYVVTDYGSVHWGVNLGVGWKAAVNFAYVDWKAAAQKIDKEYAKIEKKEGKQRNYRCAPNFSTYNEAMFSEEKLIEKKMNSGGSSEL